METQEYSGKVRRLTHSPQENPKPPQPVDKSALRGKRLAHSPQETPRLLQPVDKSAMDNRAKSPPGPPEPNSPVRVLPTGELVPVF